MKKAWGPQAKGLSGLRLPSALDAAAGVLGGNCREVLI
jgi:hypothetical protein